MKDIKIKVYPASNGESILIECNGEEQTNILVDCGYASTYKYIKDDLLEIKKNNKNLDLLILTHIDNDHINGARKLFDDYVNNEICEILEIWYNDYFSIYDIENDKEELCRIEYNIFKLLKDDEYPFDPNEIGEKNISYKSANLLVDYLQKDIIRSKLNRSFGGAVYINNNCREKRVFINDEVEIILLGPTKEILLELLNEWREYLKSSGFENDIVKSDELGKAFELFYVNQLEETDEESYFDKECSSNNELEYYLDFDKIDKKIENRSSIAFILKFYDKKLLFLGDSSPIDYEKVISNIYKNNKLQFDLVKVAHHGSKYNTSYKIFDMITSKRYLISTNGSVFDHPDLESISKIIMKQKESKELYFNYRVEKVEEFFRNYGLEDYKCKVKYENNSLIDDGIQLIEIKDERDEL